jgi:hypothetical protein
LRLGFAIKKLHSKEAKWRLKITNCQGHVAATVVASKTARLQQRLVRH